VELRPASVDERTRLFDLIRADAATYLGSGLDLLGFTWEDLAEAMATVGWTAAATVDDRVVALLWLERRGEVLHVHAIVVVPEWRRFGIGPRVLRRLAEEHRGIARVVELGVHENNAAARRMYDALGFEVVAVRPEAGFAVLRCPVESLSKTGC
jgi:ribosomal protein S18 acetylase RimI-like enzyme